ncbi:NifU family protein [Xiashengella succiniciproducens]|jgi:Fe-S cluster biogenesis protein NfuA|uniref:NifU family protein n=1 Tax=Xiashengella succiniciproducens TaxID=2949635 RepID=A0A9J6ZNW4_9BACT|nr:NifU family protein [Alkaliflexus sp. Ai-910]MDI9539790.1 NifU family protein [Bacteroidota bacterium]URW79602.1 NifU family protein [Alkaliflexus sp. Ai-910]HHU00463.1 NifU family protein [Bacteroidales bacterium]
MDNSEKDIVLKEVAAALDEIRPYLQADGGDINIIDLTDEWILKVQLIGACDGCPMSMQTLRNGVEMVIRTKVPVVREVVAV